MTKKELLGLRREKDKLERTLGGIRDMAKVPSAIWIVDTKKEHIAVNEAKKLGIPVVAILDTNCDPDEVDYPVPGNDDAIRSVSLLTRVVADSVADGLLARAGAATGGDEKPAEGAATAGTAEPLPEWERDLLEQKSADEEKLEATADAEAAQPEQAEAAQPEAQAEQAEQAEQAQPEQAEQPEQAQEAAPEAPQAAEAEQQAWSRRPSQGAAGTVAGPRPTTREAKRAMANFTAADVKRLRDLTGSGMMAVKNALTEADGDFEKATELLRLKGAKDVGKRAERTAANGLVAEHFTGSGDGALLELNSETDFVAKNAQFIELAQRLVEFAGAAPPTPPACWPPRSSPGRPSRPDRGEQRQDRRELELRRFAHFQGAYVASYLHKSDPSLPPTTGVLVELDTENTEVAKDVAQQIAAMAPKYLTREEIPAEAIEKERALAEQLTRDEGKPEQAIPRSSRAG